MVEGQCLCGAHRFELDEPLELIHHCHCGFCRKHHGSGFATLVGVPPERLRWQRGDVLSFESSPGMRRESCATCGTALPQEIAGMPMFVPAGCLGEFDERAEFHIFAASKAPWTVIADGLPAFDTYPPGVDMTPSESHRPHDPGVDDVTRGSCLCGDVTWVIQGEAITARHCHCSRCRRGRAAAHASNLVVPLDALRFTAGSDAVRRYKVPDARWFTQSFCGRCGAKTPTVDTERSIAIVPLGGLDDAPPIAPCEHIFTDDIPGWSGIHDDLPRRPGAPG